MEPRDDVATMTAARPSSRPYRLFKYTVYGLLAANIGFFFLEEAADSLELYGARWPRGHVIDAYSATVDTFAWACLLLLFELETAALPAATLKARARDRVRRLTAALRGGAYLIILYAFYGYCRQYVIFTDAEPFPVTDVCALLEQGYHYVRVDHFAPLSAEVCRAMQGQALLRMRGAEIIATLPAMREAARLAVTDIINAADWLLVVFLLEAEMRLRRRGRLSARLTRAGRYVKGALYAILFGCAVYWGFHGDFLDFWDAFLWLVAFLFIEMNVFRWRGAGA